ncbi:uncharacterized protein DUF2313 [Tumebacillus sp. BK434]|uniref:putative phage tail protein n=1 Tax=Tumebacillus sp. BK434 TaxID=2512169 RepID=UPI0010535050|nr:putative phage tail protein [Tumebacillus sp. BK434]TCP57984.1 uncharacterized protein DUF2313 [Tumebacillus sp. BK434]
MSERERDAVTLAKLQTLMSYAPTHYGRSELYQQLMEANAVESVAMRKMLEDVFAQFFVETATWGLVFWETEFGLITNESLSYQMRRALVLQKMRGTGTMTSETMAAILSSYGARTAEIDQVFESYKFGAVLVDFILSPKRPVDDVHASIRETIKTVRPVHLDFWIEYREHVAESFRAWYKMRTGREYAHSDTVRSEMTTQNEEMKFGQTEKNLFHLNHSTIGNTMFVSSELNDESSTFLERSLDHEHYDMQGNLGQAFLLNGSQVNGANRTLHAAVSAEGSSELRQTSSEQMGLIADGKPAVLFGVNSWEVPFRACADAYRFSFSRQPARLFPERLEEQAGMEQTLAVIEAHPLQVFVSQAAISVGMLNAADEMDVAKETCSCVLYRADQDGVETILEQRAL